MIDDNPSSLELLSEALAQSGLEILTASDPEEGLDLFCDRRPHIVLTDLVMPKMSGMDVLERIMEIEPGTDVILMTAHYSSESAVEAIRKGASDYLNKPSPSEYCANVSASWWKKLGNVNFPSSLKTNCELTRSFRES
jgi:DNA-binding NtrC family response regulator